jgi:hypothetical protein
VLEARNAYTWVMPWRPTNPPGVGTPSCPVSFSGNSSFGAPSGCAGAVGVYPSKDLRTICPYHPFGERPDDHPCETPGCRSAGQCLNPYLYEPVSSGAWRRRCMWECAGEVVSRRAGSPLHTGPLFQHLSAHTRRLSLASAQRRSAGRG